MKKYIIFIILMFGPLSLMNGATLTVVAGDVNSLQSNWDLLNNNDVLYIPDGTYTVQSGMTFPLTNNNYNIVVQGESRDGVIIDFAGYDGFYCGGSIDIVFKNLTIKNATQGGVHCADYRGRYESIVNVENVHFLNNTEGSLVYEGLAWPTSIKDCVFSGNSMPSGEFWTSAGIYIGESSDNLIIERNVFYDNSCSDDGVAICIANIFDGNVTLQNNLIYDNSGAAAVYFFEDLGASTQVALKNNTIAKNANGGVKFGSSFSGFTKALDQNMIVDNSSYDISGSITLSGDYNIVESVSGTSISGSNNDIGTSAAYFTVVSDELDYTNYGADVAIAKISSAYPSLDAYGEARDGMYCDIGGLNVPLDTLTLWTGAGNSHVWTNSNNWYRGQVSNSTSFKRVDIFPVSSSNYPIISSNTSLNNVRFKVKSKAILKNSTTMTCKSILVESDDDGDGQFVDAGSMTVTGSEIYEQQLIAGQWNFLGVPANVTAGNLLPNHTLNTDYWLAYYDGNNRANQGMVNNWVDITSNSDVLEAKKGYIIWVDSDITVEFSSRPATDIVDVTYHSGAGGYNNEGWNLVGNPYSIALESDDVISDNSGVIRGAVYVYNSSGVNYDTRAGGIGSASYIPGHQSFFMQADVSTNFYFETSAALYSTAYQFKSNEMKSYITLKVNDDKGNENETFLRVKEDASSAFDGLYDAYEFVTSSDLLVYSHLDGVDYSINTFNLNEDNFEVPLRLQMKDAVQRFSMVFSTEAFEDYTAMLYDKELDNYHMIVDGDSIVFDVEEQDVKSRFELRLANNVVTRHVSNEQSERVKIQPRPNGLYVDLSNLNSLATIRVMDVSGRVIAENAEVYNGLDVPLPMPGLYLISVQQGNERLNYKYMY